MTGRLAVSVMGSGKLLVFDARNQSVISELGGFPKVTGVLMVPDLKKLYASVPGAGIGASVSVALGMSGMGKGSGAVAILDSATLKEIARLPAGVFPDGIAYDARDRRVFISDELGGGLTVVGADDDKPIARIDTGGEVGNVQYDPISRLVYVPVQSHDELIAVDPDALKVVARHKLGGCRHPHGLRIAEQPSSSEAVGRNSTTAIGYVACDGNDRLLAVDLPSGKITADLAIGHDPDVLAADPGLRRLYIASESGMLSVVDTRDAARPVKLGDVMIGEDAHSVAVDPTNHHLFLPLRNLNGKAVMRILAPK